MRRSLWSIIQFFRVSEDVLVFCEEVPVVLDKVLLISQWTLVGFDVFYGSVRFGY